MASAQIPGTPDYNETKNRLEIFSKYFVELYEAKLEAYTMFLEGKLAKAGKFSDFFSDKIGQGAGALLALFLLPISLKIGAQAGKSIAEPIGKKLGKDHHGKKIESVLHLLECWRKDKPGLRNKLVEAALDVGQSFEMQLMFITARVGGYREALRFVALDSVNRSFNYYEKFEKTIEQVTISQSVLLGNSKIETVIGIPCDVKYIKTPGFTIYYKCENTEMVEWLTSSLFEKSGIVIDTPTLNTYYKLNSECDTFTYGYRRLLNCEIAKWSELEKNYLKEHDLTKTVHFTDYNYKFYQGTDRFSLLDHLNEKDPKLLEERINKLLAEIKDSILHELQALIDAQEIDHNLLISIEEYLTKYYSCIGNNFVEILYQQNNLLELSIENQRETVSHLNLATQERHEIADENIRHHLETQRMVARVDRKFDQFNNPPDSKTPSSFKYKVRACDLNYIRRYNANGLCKTDEINGHFYPSIRSNHFNNAIPIVYISGLGGVGKSEEGRKYCKFWWDKHAGLDRALLWIDCTTITSFIDTFKSIGLELATWINVPKTEKEIIEAIYSYFLDRETLFVFDNADEYVQKFLPQSVSLVLHEGQKLPYILMTSRTKFWDGEHEGFAIFQRISLGAFTEQEGLNYVKVCLHLSLEKTVKDNDIFELCKLLHFLPLALRQAVAYIQAERASVGDYAITEYIAEYNKNGKKLLNFRPYKNDEERYSNTVFTTWLTTLKKIKNQSGGDQARDILNILAYLFANAIDLHKILGISVTDNMGRYSPDPDKNLRAGIQLLSKYSMIDLDSDNLVYVHELVQKVVRIQLRKPSIVYLSAFGLTIASLLCIIAVAIFSFEPALSRPTLFSLSVGLISFLYFILNTSDNTLGNTEKATIDTVLGLLNSKKVSRDGDTTAHAAFAWSFATNYCSLIDKYYLKTCIDNLDDSKFPIQRYGTLDDTPLHILSCAYTEAVARLLHRMIYLAKSKYKKESTFKGIILNANNAEGKIPLHVACLFQKSKIITLLIENGADITATDNKHGWGVLTWTVLGTENGKDQNALGTVLDYIIHKNEALLEDQDLEFLTPLRVALLKQTYSAAKLLVIRGADVNADCSNYMRNHTYLHDVVLMDHVNMAKFLINYNANIEAKDVDGNTPLHLAVNGNFLNMTKMLCKHGADVNVKNADDFSPLHIAVFHNNLDIIFTLLTSKNININQIGNKSLTPVELAFFDDDEESWATAIFLLAAGANIGDLIRKSINFKSRLSNLIAEKCNNEKEYTEKFTLVKQLLESENGEENIQELNEYIDLK